MKNFSQKNKHLNYKKIPFDYLEITFFTGAYKYFPTSALSSSYFNERYCIKTTC